MGTKINYRELGAVVLGSLAFALVIFALGLTPPLEVFGFVTGVTGVWLAAKNHVWSWPVGLLNAGAYIFVYLKAQFYPDAGLYGFYIISGLYGWYWWLRGGEQKTEAPIASVPKKEWPFTLGLGIIASALITAWMYQINSAAPLFDTVLVVVSIVAQYWMTRRYIECWVLWITVDVCFVALYWWKGLYLTGWLFAIYLVIAYFGLVNWNKERQQKTGVVAPMPARKFIYTLFAIGGLFWIWIGWICVGFLHGMPKGTIDLYKAAHESPTIKLSVEVVDPRTGLAFGTPKYMSDENKKHFLNDLLDPMLYRPLKKRPNPEQVPVQRVRFLEEGKDGQMVERLKYEIFLDHVRVEGQNQSLNVWERVKRYLPNP